MSSLIPFLETSGPAADLETFAYLRNEFPVLPDPQSDIPFHKQGMPLPDPFVNVGASQVVQATTIQPINPFPFGHFVGKVPRQINQPQFLSINEDIYIQ